VSFYMSLSLFDINEQHRSGAQDGRVMLGLDVVFMKFSRYTNYLGIYA
jgi:hypothetical protein